MSTVRVLLADDHAVVRAGIRKAIEDMPDLLIVGEVGDGLELASALESLQPTCLLIDVTMPDFAPIDEMRRIRAHYPLLRILVISAYDDDVYVQGLLSAGVNGYHLKDQPLSDLRLAVERVIAGKRWISSPLLDKLLQPLRSRTDTPRLSERQRSVLQALLDGRDNRAIAQALGLSIKTIENHLTRLYRQLDVQSRLEAANYVREHPEIMAQPGGMAVATPNVIHLPQARQVAVLLVDDNRRYRHQLSRMIGKAYPKAMTYEAATTAEATHLTRTVSPHIAFVDVVLADEDGIRCTRHIKAVHSVMRVVLISAYPDREFHRLGLQAGAIALLDKKDIDVSTLHQMIADTAV
jgi:DNA-binding NarL/FixJ family response regulator